MRPAPDQCRRLGHQRKEFIIVYLTNRHTGLSDDDNVAILCGCDETRSGKRPGRYQAAGGKGCVRMRAYGLAGKPAGPRPEGN